MQTLHNKHNLHNNQIILIHLVKLYYKLQKENSAAIFVVFQRKVEILPALKCIMLLISIQFLYSLVI